jgi:hypothetical protein
MDSHISLGYHSEGLWHSMSATRWGRTGQALAVGTGIALTVAAIGLAVFGIQALANKTNFVDTLLDGLKSHEGHLACLVVGGAYAGWAISHIAKENPPPKVHIRQPSDLSETGVTQGIADDDVDTFSAEPLFG